MDTNVIALLGLKIVAVLVLVLLNGFFVAAEFALVRIRGTELDTLVAKGHKQAQTARHIVNNLNAFLSAAQLGITLASLGLGWIGEPVFKALLSPVLTWLGISSPEWGHSISFVVGFSAITFLHIVAGEQAPKALAIQKPLAAALGVAATLSLFYRISYPFIWVLNHSSLWLLQQFGIRPAGEAERLHSEEELRLILVASQRHPGEAGVGRDIVLNALDLRHQVAREVMRPRQEIVTLDTRASLAECLDVAEQTRFSRFPLCDQGDIDKTLGTVHIKDLYAMRLRARSGQDLVPVARRLIYVPESARLEKLLHLFLDRKLHLAIVVDEYGGTVGMVTLENILEVLVGQIQDEFDQEKPLLEPSGDQTWVAAGALPLRELAELVLEPIQEEGITTASGLVTQRLGGFPKVGDTLTLGACELRVEALDGPRVARLRIRRVPAKGDEKTSRETPVA
jgi:CBS domain containing-hemolysin-like protein